MNERWWLNKVGDASPSIMIPFKIHIHILMNFKIVKLVTANPWKKKKKMKSNKNGISLLSLNEVDSVFTFDEHEHFKVQRQDHTVNCENYQLAGSGFITEYHNIIVLGSWSYRLPIDFRKLYYIINMEWNKMMEEKPFWMSFQVLVVLHQAVQIVEHLRTHPS